MQGQTRATSQFLLWWEWYKASLNVWNYLLPDEIDHPQGRHSLSPWLAWNATCLETWNQILVPWMKTQAFTQLLRALAETYGPLYAAFDGLARADQELQAAGSLLFPPGVGQTPRTLVWTKKPARLYRYGEPAQAPVKYRTPLLMVYALINKPYILDLLPGRSLIGYLVQHGIDVYLLDWGTPGPEERRLRFDDLVLEYLPDCIHQVQSLSGEEHLNIFGYCIGGVLITLYNALHADAPFNSMILLATPLDFSDAELFSGWLDPHSYDVDRLVDTMGNVPPSFITSGGLLLNLVGAPALLREYAEDARFLEVWQALRFWGVDGVPFPGEAFRQWIKDFYQGNKLMTDQFTLAGQRVQLSSIRTPLLNISAASDHVVALTQTSSTLDKISSAEKEWIILPGSHFGLVSSPKAVHDLWPRVVAWLAKHAPG